MTNLNQAEAYIADTAEVVAINIFGSELIDNEYGEAK